MIDSRNIFGGSTSMSATKLLYNRFSVAGYTALQSIVGGEITRVSASGALTANTLVDLINESGSAGEISHFAIATTDSTSRTLRVVITVDGTSIYDYTSASITTGSTGVALAGQYNASFSIWLPPIKYTNSIRIQYASSLTETGKFTTYLAYQKVT